ncbi:alpha-L-fucosidase, partial [Elizabethkingia anophelis]|uniref:alpha-L-fucosidase n=1 Tax=Elizabethkingia anophelis TaxID=1117645 RepID=UPI00389235E9
MRKILLKIGMPISIGLATILQAQSNNEKKERVAVKYGPITPAHRTDETMQKFRQYGLGQFIHWGIYSIPGGEWNGTKATGVSSEWIRAWGG